MRAVVVGVRNYDGATVALDELPGAPELAAEIAAQLEDSDWRCNVLVDSEPGSSVTGAQIRLATEALFRGPEAALEDDLLFYFVGHAYADPPGPTTNQAHERLMAYDGEAMALVNLAEYINTSTCMSMTIILDCCHSGALLEELKPAAKNRCSLFLATTKREELGYALGNGKAFALSTRFNNGLISAHERRSTAVTTTSMDKYLRAKVLEAASKPTDDARLSLYSESNHRVLLSRATYRRQDSDESSGHARSIKSPHGDLVVRTDGRRLGVGWLVQPDGEERAWRRGSPPLQEGERAVAITRAGDDAAYVLVAAESGARLLRVEQDGSVRSAGLDVRGVVRGAEFGTGRDVGLAFLELADGSAQKVSVVGLDLRPGSGAAA